MHIYGEANKSNDSIRMKRSLVYRTKTKLSAMKAVIGCANWRGAA
jgi:hypothetical protein